MVLINNLKDVPSLISKSVSIVGDIKNAANIEIEGKIEGNIFADIITLREGGEIFGNVKSKVFNIKGKFNGNVSSDKINISDEAVVSGLLEYNFLSVDYGASINCELKRINDKNNNKDTVESFMKGDNDKTKETKENKTVAEKK